MGIVQPGEGKLCIYKATVVAWNDDGCSSTESDTLSVTIKCIQVQIGWKSGVHVVVGAWSCPLSLV